MENWATALQKSIARWDVTLPPDGLDNFRVYLDILNTWNNRMNLTALKEPEHIALGHFADSIAAMTLDVVFKAKGIHAIDIGTGAGFPGLPLEIVNPNWHMTLLESVSKKCDFLRAVVGAMELNRVTILSKRSEVLGHEKEYREKYDLAFSRALSNLSTLIEYSLPLLKVGGSLVAHRGRTAADEISRVDLALEQLGAEVSEVHHYEISGLAGSRSLVVIKKVKPTSKHYPRRTGIPAKRPL
ncbi:16S rRNA (guanine(527)-N(7))-methyltransferase RsmG [bacterium F11]|nr:16S rRNA (guanine(527)-N(7))-methyltransferase RsmG [bacterium F11]